jgi:IS605 OrfB family transposase
VIKKATAKKKLREIAAPFVVAAPSGMRIRTRLHLTEEEATVLTETGTFLGSLASKDLAARCALGRGHKHLGRAERKKALTAQTSSRLAGSITASSDDQWQLSYDNLYRDLFSLRDEIALIEKRCAIPTGTSVTVNKRTIAGYPTPGVRHAKQQRLQVLKARLKEAESRIEAGHVSVARGGKGLLNNRHHLGEAGLTEYEWTMQWRARRLFLTADGEKDKLWGNETIRINPDTGVLALRLPSALAHLSNTEGRVPSFVLDAPVAFSYHDDEWAAQVASGAVSYTISFDPTKSRWYLDASWSVTKVPTPSLEALHASNTLGVDLNADHLACWVIAHDGNPVGSSVRVELKLTGSTERRDGLLRAAIAQLLNVAEVNNCRSITIENLNFTDARSSGRETMGMGKRGKTFRRTVSDMPTAKFRDRLNGMADNRGISIIAVDPAYTSKWGAEHWARPLKEQSKESNQPPTRHECAAVVIGRRGKQHRARTTTHHRPARHQRMANGQSVVGDHSTVETKTGNTGTDKGNGRAVTKTHLRESDEPVKPGPTRPFGRPASGHVT